MTNAKTYHLKTAQIPKKITLLLICSLLITKATTKTTVLNTSVCKDLTKFEFNGGASDGFTIDRDPITLENSKITASGSGTSPKVFSSNCHVIQMGTKENEQVFETSAREIHFTYNASGSSDFDTIVLVAQYNMGGVNSHQVSDVFAKYQEILQDKATNAGYLGYTSGKTMYILLPNSLGTFNLEGNNTCEADSTISGDSIIRRNCLFDGDNLSEYFVNEASYSVGTWMLIGLTCFFFIMLLGSNDEMNMNNENLKNNPMTLHPIYSLWKVGTNQFTKGSRYAQMTVSLTIIYLTSTIITVETIDNNSYDFIVLLFASAICGIIAAWIVTYFTGFLLRRARNVDRAFLDDIDNNFSGTDLKEKKEQYERDSFVRYYEFYTVCGIIVLTVVIGIFIFF